MRAKLVAQNLRTDARLQLHAPTPPLEPLKMVLSEIVTGVRGSSRRREYFHAPSCRRIFVELPQDDHQVRDEHRSYGTRDATQNWEEELASTLSNLKTTRGIMCLYVRRGCIEDEDVVATVHGSAVTLWRRTKGSRMPRQDDSTEVRDAQTSGW